MNTGCTALYYMCVSGLWGRPVIKCFITNSWPKCMFDYDAMQSIQLLYFLITIYTGISQFVLNVYKIKLKGFTYLSCSILIFNSFLFERKSNRKALSLTSPYKRERLFLCFVGSFAFLFAGSVYKSHYQWNRSFCCAKRPWLEKQQFWCRRYGLFAKNMHYLGFFICWNFSMDNKSSNGVFSFTLRFIIPWTNHGTLKLFSLNKWWHLCFRGKRMR